MELKDRVKCPQLGCTKEIYDTAEQARVELRRILETQRKLTEVKPNRIYECQCGYFCLTSKPKITEY